MGLLRSDPAAPPMKRASEFFDVPPLWRVLVLLLLGLLVGQVLAWHFLDIPAHRRHSADWFIESLLEHGFDNRPLYSDGGPINRDCWDGVSLRAPASDPRTPMRYVLGLTLVLELFIVVFLLWWCFPRLSLSSDEGPLDQDHENAP